MCQDLFSSNCNNNNNRSYMGVEKGEQFFELLCPPRCLVTLGDDNLIVTFPQYSESDLQRRRCQATSLCLPIHVSFITILSILGKRLVYTTPRSILSLKQILSALAVCWLPGCATLSSIHTVTQPPPCQAYCPRTVHSWDLAPLCLMLKEYQFLICHHHGPPPHPPPVKGELGLPQLLTPPHI